MNAFEKFKELCNRPITEHKHWVNMPASDYTKHNHYVLVKRFNGNAYSLGGFDSLKKAVVARATRLKLLKQRKKPANYIYITNYAILNHPTV